MRHNSKSVFIKLVLSFMLVLCLLFSQVSFVQAEEAAADAKDTEYLKSIMDMIREKYKGELRDDQLLEGAIKGMLNSLDPYTTYFTPEEYEDFYGSINGTYVGIGIALDLSGDYIMVAKVFSSTPAEKAGILQGDRIAEVDGKSMLGKTTEEAASLIMGGAGTKVRLGIVRNGRKEIIPFEIMRDTIKINPVTYEIRDGIGYIKLEMFNSNTYEYMSKALEEMDRNNINRIILDLRGNPGGEVSQAVGVARNFVPRGVVTTLDYKSEAYTDQVYRSYLDKSKYKLAVLVNGMSASASEIVAGSIQDTSAGTLVGTKTYGKGSFQSTVPILSPEAFAKYEEQVGSTLADAFDLSYTYGVNPLESDIIGYAKMTLGVYYTPTGRMINGTGLTPDFVVEDPALISGIDINGIQKLTRAAKPGLNSQGADVYNAEKILKVLGYDIDTPDTTLDINTFTVIRQFQKAEKMYSYGVLDFSTQKALNEALNSFIAGYDKQYAKAVELLNK